MLMFTPNACYELVWRSAKATIPFAWRGICGYSFFALRPDWTDHRRPANTYQIELRQAQGISIPVQGRQAG